MSKNTFDRIAWMYDGLAHVVFGGAIRKSQLYFLPAITPRSNVLIIGGGTGWLLVELDKLNIQMVIDYVETSENMIKKSVSRKPFANLEINFIHGTEQSINEKGHYDIIITNFFLDVFTEENLSRVIPKLSSCLKDTGRWLMTDFVDNGKIWQKLLVKVMYAFFRFTANLEGSKLIDFSEYFRRSEFRLIDEKTSFHGMIVSRIYAK